LSRITNVSRFTIYRLESGKQGNLDTTKKVLGYLLKEQIEASENALINAIHEGFADSQMQQEIDILKTQHQNLMSL
jgi:hypothetical protein